MPPYQNDQTSEDNQRLNVETNDVDGVMYCKSRLQDEYSIYLPDVYPYTKSIVRDAHEQALHGGVRLKGQTEILGAYTKTIGKKSNKGIFQMSKIFLPNQLQDHQWEICREIVQKTQGKTYVTLFGSNQCRAIYFEL